MLKWFSIKGFNAVAKADDKIGHFFGFRNFITRDQEKMMLSNVL